MTAATVLYGDTETTAELAEPDRDALWITLPELTATAGWELRAEGVCKDPARIGN